MATGTAAWRAAWLALAGSLALHVTDEALTGFLPLYNAMVEAVRARLPWAPFPTFTFPVWITGLSLAVVLLFALTPVVARGARWIRIASIGLAMIMMGNAIGHAVASVYWHGLAPGATSSPILFVAATALLVTALSARTGGAPGRPRS